MILVLLRCLTPRTINFDQWGNWMDTAEKIQRHANAVAAFINHSPSPYHAAMCIEEFLESKGFESLDESAEWNLEPDGKYYTTRNHTSLIAFRFGSVSTGIRAIGAHLDSPCLRLSPNASFNRIGYEQFNVEVYGSALLRTWFDRDLSLAGRVFVQNSDGSVMSLLIDADAPLAVIPSVAIHLERKANEVQEINSQIHMNPIFSIDVESDNQSLETALVKANPELENDFESGKILSHDLRFYDMNEPRITGISGEFLSSARIDNLLSCFAGMYAIANASTDNFCMLVCNDHEEVGSISDSGAGGTFLSSVLERTVGLNPTVIRRSMLLSADGAHGIHPNYPEKHDAAHAPVLNQGVVIKVNANQRYATSDETNAYIRWLCDGLEIPSQTFVSRNDMACGSTIGPIVASELGIKTADVGVAQFAMHSIRELAGTKDALDFTRLLTAFLESEQFDFGN